MNHVVVAALPSLDNVTRGLSGLGSAAIGYLGMDIIQIILGIGLVLVAISLAKRAVNKLAFFVILAAIYLFSRGLLNMGTILEWWHNVPNIINQILMLGR